MKPETKLRNEIEKAHKKYCPGELFYHPPDKAHKFLGKRPFDLFMGIKQNPFAIADNELTRDLYKEIFD